MNLQGYNGPRTKGYKTSLTNSGCKLGEGFKISQQCSSGRAFNRKSTSNTQLWHWQMLHHLWHMGHMEALATDCSVRGSNCSQQGTAVSFSVPNPADQQQWWSRTEVISVVDKEAGVQRSQGESFTKSMYIRVQFIVYNPFLFWTYLNCIISIQPDNVCASRVI